MDIQATLTLTIQAVIMSFVALMVFDFVDGLWVVPLPPAGWQPLQGEQPPQWGQSQHNLLASHNNLRKFPTPGRYKLNPLTILFQRHS